MNDNMRTAPAGSKPIENAKELRILRLAEELSDATRVVSFHSVRVAAKMPVDRMALAHDLIVLNDTMIELATVLGLHKSKRIDL
jgi:hypothetical protein